MEPQRSQINDLSLGRRAEVIVICGSRPPNVVTRFISSGGLGLSLRFGPLPKDCWKELGDGVAYVPQYDQTGGGYSVICRSMRQGI